MLAKKPPGVELGVFLIRVRVVRTWYWERRRKAGGGRGAVLGGGEGGEKGGRGAVGGMKGEYMPRDYGTPQL